MGRTSLNRQEITPKCQMGLWAMLQARTHSAIIEAHRGTVVVEQHSNQSTEAPVRGSGR